MAENDIYNNKRKYELLAASVEDITAPPAGGKKIYYCKNPANVIYFHRLLTKCEAKDLSYIRRCKLIYILRRITYHIDKELTQVTRDDIDMLIASAHKTHLTLESKRDFLKDLKCIWRMLLPDKDEKGRADETICPYVVRHVRRQIDKSKQKRRQDKITWDEFTRLLKFYDREPRMQAYLALSVESLGRPQEILYTRIRDCEVYDNYAKIWISSHGKEGIGFLQCLDSFPYVVRWLKQHPFKDDPDSLLFINLGNRGLYKQMTPININKRLKHAMKALKIDKTITCYSLKRNGVTFARNRGESDSQIQHKARWTSTQRIQTYDMTTQDDAFKERLRKEGVVRDSPKMVASVKKCGFCEFSNGFTSEYCGNCKRPLDRTKMEEMQKLSDQMIKNQLIQQIARLEQKFTQLSNVR